MKKIIISTLVLCLVISLLAGNVFALTASPMHSGNTDDNGRHLDKYNVSGLGKYHYHHGYGPHPHFNGKCIWIIENHALFISLLLVGAVLIRVIAYFILSAWASRAIPSIPRGSRGQWFDMPIVLAFWSAILFSYVVLWIIYTISNIWWAKLAIDLGNDFILTTVLTMGVLRAIGFIVHTFKSKKQA